MNKEKYIILPDVHNSVNLADEIIEFERPNKVIFLGDYFDNFGDYSVHSKRTALWLKKKLENPNNIMLVGNHDFAYIYPNNRNAICSGFSKSKSETIRTILSQEELDSLKTFHIYSGILFSHAGISSNFFEKFMPGGNEKDGCGLEEMESLLSEYSKEAKHQYSIGSKHPLFGAGFNRGGDQSYGGIIWEDARSHVPMKGIKQVIGHTYGKKPYLITINKKDRTNLITVDNNNIKDGKLSNNLDLTNSHWTLCLDTNLNHYAVIEGSQITIIGFKSEVYTEPHSLISDRFLVSSGFEMQKIDI